MKKHYLKLVVMLVFSVCVNAQAVSDSSQEEVIYANPEAAIDYVSPQKLPELIADSIVIYVPDKDMSLHIPETTERVIKGHVIKVEKGVEPNLIIFKADTITTPLEKGVPVKLFLKRFPDREAYYPIAIDPVNSDEVTESTSLENFQLSTNPTTNLAENAVGLWQDIDNEAAYYSFHQNGNTVIIIDLLRLESSGDKFSATYKGSVEDYILNPMSPGLLISVTFQSDKEAIIMPICDTCSVVITKIKKVF